MQRQLNDQGEKLNIIQMLGGLLPLINQITPSLGMLNDTELNDVEPPTQTDRTPICDFRLNDCSEQT